MSTFATLRNVAIGFALAASFGAAQAAPAYAPGYASGSTGYVGPSQLEVQRVIIKAPAGKAERSGGYAAGSTGYVGKSGVDNSTAAKTPDAPRRYALGSTGVVLYPEGSAVADSAVAAQ